MSIIIIRKSKKPSNKSQTLPVHIPIIDKVSFVLTPSEAHAPTIHKLAHDALNDVDYFQSAGPPRAGYKRARFISLKGTLERPRLDYAFGMREGIQHATRLRLEFNPAKFEPCMLSEMSTKLGFFLDGGMVYVTKHATISRLDIAIDLPGLRMGDFLYLPNQSATNMQWRFSAGGHPETIVHGKAKGNQTVVYDKRTEQLAKGKRWTGASVVRVERRLRGLGKRVCDLPAMANPFAGISLLIAAPPPPKSDTAAANSWTIFMDSVSVRTLENSLALLPKAKRTFYRAHLRNHPLPLWDINAFWQEWPHCLARLGWGTSA